MWPSLTERLARHKFIYGVLKGRHELPLFCNPLVIFVLNWALMMVSLSFQVTYVTYPTMGIPILLFALSLGSFLFGYLVSRTLLHRWPTSSGSLTLHAGCNAIVASQPAVLRRGHSDYRVQLGAVWSAAGHSATLPRT